MLSENPTTFYNKQNHLRESVIRLADKRWADIQNELKELRNLAIYYSDKTNWDYGMKAREALEKFK